MKLSRKVRWLQHEPICYTLGDLYFRLEARGFWPKVQYVRVRGGSRRRIGWWMRHLLNHTEAREVHVLHPVKG